MNLEHRMIETLRLRMPHEMKWALEERAKSRNLSLSQYVRLLIEADLNSGDAQITKETGWWHDKSYIASVRVIE